MKLATIAAALIVFTRTSESAPFNESTNPSIVITTASPSFSTTATPTTSPTSVSTQPPTDGPTATTNSPTASPTIVTTVSPTSGPTSSTTTAPTTSPTSVSTHPPTDGPTATTNAPSIPQSDSTSNAWYTIYISDVLPMFIDGAPPSNVALDVQPDMFTKEIKQKIQSKLGIHTGTQHLFIVDENNENKFLHDDRKINEYNISNKSTVYLVSRLPSPTERISRIYVTDFVSAFGKDQELYKVAIAIDPDDTLGDVKIKIQDALRIPVDSQVLLHGDHGDYTILDNDRMSLSALGVSNGDVLLLEVQLQHELVQHELECDGKPMVLDGLNNHVCIDDYTPGDTIRDIKAKIQKKEGIPVERQLFVRNKNEMFTSNDAIFHESDSILEFHVVMPGRWGSCNNVKDWGFEGYENEGCDWIEEHNEQDELCGQRANDENDPTMVSYYCPSTCDSVCKDWHLQYSPF